MYLNTHPLRNAIIIALLASSTPALAQSDTDGVTNVERIEITGSRIRQVSLETAQPVLVINRAEIEKKGHANIADILQDVTAAGAPALSRSSTLSSERDFGGLYMNLRDLGPERTLVLIDGRRMGISAGGYSDLASIPSAIVDRVEVLTDGASAMYGSDAIAGVVNIITRKHLNGLEASAYVGEYGQGDGSKTAYSGVFGTAFARGRLAIGAEITKEDPVMARNRAFSAYPAGPYHRDEQLSAISASGGVMINGVAMTLRPGGNPANLADFVPLDASNFTNPNTSMSLQTGLERKSVFANGAFDLTDQLHLVADVLHTKREASQQLAGYPYLASGDDGRALLSADSVFNHWGQDLQFAHRTDELPRHTRNNLTTKRASLGLEGSFTVGANYWDWNVGYTYNRSEGERISRGNLFQPHVDQAVGPSFIDANGAIRCGSAGNVIAGCMPWNPLAPMGTTSPGSLSDPALRDHLFVRVADELRTTSRIASANLSGSLLNLPAGDLMLAVGVEHREEQASYTPDPITRNGQVAGIDDQPTRGGYKLDEAYLELQVPLLADVALARELSLSIAARYSDYSNFGDTTNGKFSLMWKPIDSLLARATFSTGFRAPTINNLYGGAASTRDYLTDPCDTLFGAAARNADVAARCIADGLSSTFRQQTADSRTTTTVSAQSVADFSVGSNPNLDPETARTWTAGLVYSPGAVPGLDLSLDWWKVRINDVIVGESATDILNQCYGLGSAAACDRFERYPDGGFAGQVSAMDRSLNNAGYQETAGYDIGIRYRLPELSIGKFAINWNTTYVDYLEHRSDDASTTPVVQFAGWAGNFRVRSSLNLDWQYNNLGIAWTMRYYSGMKEACFHDLSGGRECNRPDFSSPYTGAQPSRILGSNTFHDLQVRYNLPWNGTVSLGANNVFGHVGPVLYSQPSSDFSYYGGFDIGRFMYLKYQQRF